MFILYYAYFVLVILVLAFSVCVGSVRTGADCGVTAACVRGVALLCFSCDSSLWFWVPDICFLSLIGLILSRSCRALLHTWVLLHIKKCRIISHLGFRWWWYKWLTTVDRLKTSCQPQLPTKTPPNQHKCNLVWHLNQSTVLQTYCHHNSTWCFSRHSVILPLATHHTGHLSWSFFSEWTREGICKWKPSNTWILWFKIVSLFLYQVINQWHLMV